MRAAMQSRQRDVARVVGLAAAAGPDAHLEGLALVHLGHHVGHDEVLGLVVTLGPAWCPLGLEATHPSIGKRRQSKHNNVAARESSLR